MVLAFFFGVGVGVLLVLCSLWRSAVTVYEDANR